MNPIPFNKLFVPPDLKSQIQKWMQGEIDFFEKDYSLLVKQQLSEITGYNDILLTSSCTHALEICALLLDLKPGDEVILPSYTFVSSANPIVLRGAVPVFIDIRSDTLNLDEKIIESAITKKTKAIIAVHYAGIAAEMDKILQVAAKYRIPVIEDAAHGIMATYKDRSLGALSDMGCISFDASKNIHSYKGGALLINNPQRLDRARIILEKGTNRFDFDSGKSDFYTWVDVGSNYGMNPLNAFYLYYQLQNALEITNHRKQLWNRYQSDLSPFADKLGLQLPIIPEECNHNAHIFYTLCPDTNSRNGLIKHFAENGITAPFHYMPLHSSPAGIKYGRFSGEDVYTTSISKRIIRLPLFHELTIEQVDRISNYLIAYFQKN
jgi:dTDP-4-amino-4,6-dideoxygalactose transaminase